jgi:urease accessory protein
MLRCNQILAPGAAAAKPTHELQLGFDERAKSRLAAVCSDGTAIAIMLPRGSVMRDGALLAADDGSLVRVIAAEQPVVRVTAGTPVALLRAVYHLANRHVPARIAADHVLIEPDPVLEQMLVTLGARVEHLQLPFDPEPGAYVAHSHPAPTPDDASATVGEQLSIEAHRDRMAALTNRKSESQR